MSARQTIIFTCDGCGEEAEAPAGGVSQTEDLPEGWEDFLFGSNFKHFCPECLRDAEQFGKEFVRNAIQSSFD